MAERLTEFNKTGWVLKLGEPQNEFEARQQLMSKFKLACEKLGKIEDLLEKYGIESLDTLEHIIKKGKVIIAVADNVSIYEEIQKDRDTWKRACELACDAMTKLGGDDCCGCRLNKEMCKICENKKGLIDYFYQQAKKEGENNDTNN